jgi:K+-sensing histidine kinase KdpD
MSHDMKTPINAITGFSRVILKGIDGPITDFQQEDLTSIYEAGKKLLAMVNDLFAVRKRDVQRPAVYGESFEIVTLFSDVMRTVQPLAAESGHRLILDIDGALGSMTADPSMVRWVVLGLLMYVIRETEQGILRISVRRELGLEGPRLSTRVACEGNVENQGGSEATVGGVSELAKEDLVLHTCLSFCEALGGELSSLQTGDGVSFQFVLPVRLSETTHVG